MGFVNGQPADPAEPQASFFMHFGHFIWQYSNVEKLCHMVFRWKSGVKDEIARALIGGEQMSKITKLLLQWPAPRATKSKLRKFSTSWIR